MRVLAISGSLREKSSNTATLLAAARLAPPSVRITLYSGLADLPPFNPDIDDDPPQEVLAFRNQIVESEGLVISSPEYARGIAGTLKNALDWLVSSTDFPGKPVLIFNASPRATDSDSALRLVLKTMSARLIGDASIVLPIMGRNLDVDGILADPALVSSIRRGLDRLLETADSDGRV